MQISADSAVASLFGAFGKFLYDNDLQLTDIGQVNLTGVGSSEIRQDIYGVPTFRVDEFSANGVGKIQELASGGKVGNIDLRIGDISKNPLPGLDLEITASNFGKASSRANCEDKAAGIVHMVIETICQTAVLISNGTDIKDFVLIGNLINFPECWNVCEMIRTMYPHVNFIIPEDGEYGTAIGTALANKCCLKPVK